MKEKNSHILKITLFFIAVMFSCTFTNIKVIDGCEYIETTTATGNGPIITLTHKGNCKNPIHAHEQIKQDSVKIDYSKILNNPSPEIGPLEEN